MTHPIRAAVRAAAAAAFVAGVTLAATPAQAATGDQGPPTGRPANSAVAVNTRDGSSVFRIAFSIVRVSGPSVTATNTAFAYASCTSCETVAVAMQVILATGSPNVVTPQNAAIAYNYQCNSCDTFASAYQDLVMTGTPVRFTPQGHQQLASIRRQLEGLRHDQLSFTQLQADVKSLEQQLAQVVATQLVPAGHQGPSGSTPDVGTTGPGPADSPGPTSMTSTSGGSTTTSSSTSSTTSTTGSTTTTTGPTTTTTTSGTTSTTSG